MRDDSAVMPPLDPMEAESSEGASWGRKLAIVALVVVGLFIAHQTGLLALVREPSRLRLELLALGSWGFVAYVAAYAVLQPFGVPGSAFVFAAPLIWPWPVAFALSMVGTMSASVVGFSFARFVARDWISKRIPARFRAYDKKLAAQGFTTVFTLRFIFWMPPMLHAFFGVSKVPFWTHFWGSLAGYVIPLLATAYFGEKVFRFVLDAPWQLWGALVVTAVLATLAVWAFRRHRRLAAQAKADAPEEVKACSKAP